MMKLFRSLTVLAIALSMTACVTNRSLGEGLDDSASNLTLKRYLFADNAHDYGDVDITVFESRLLLSGTVRTTEARRALAQKAAMVSTVDDVLNEVIVGPKTGIRQGAADALIDERLGAALLADNGVFSSNYKIAVSQGTVYLLGVAQGPEELGRVTGQAQAISGVKNIVSHVIYVGDPKRAKK
ncbi:BON domain-containing protein [Parvularcula sp. LCG005]|uniref:BON domain-containing protein n=1 Tax=Parvularcula sp. LCG005 TaxID=3078805 RepID=UPI0029423627|nr:BON domain-containing protein [Parvularcula sp. LCG005]WOI53521.1 BON domain-containing protein [Parvularcula sp. LCG005]